MIIGLLNQKGGVGKTTLSVNMAHCFSKSYLKPEKQFNVLVVDADPQQSVLQWSAFRDENNNLPFRVMGLPTKYINRDLPAIAADYDFVIIDGPPRSNEIAISCIKACDVVLIPCTPSPYDIWSSSETIRIVEERMSINPNMKAFISINRRIINTAIDRDATAALADFVIPTLKNKVSQRVVFAESAAAGLTVFDVDPNGIASKEIISLCKELMEEIDYEFKG